MKNSTLCYIENDNKYLMLYRNKKLNDSNKGKYVGIGGQLEENESPYDGIIREAIEETGLTLNSPEYRAIITFVSNQYETEQMHLFTCKNFSGDLIDCDEGELRWIEKTELENISMWTGDIIFLRMLDEENNFFSLKLVYENDILIETKINGK